MHYQTRQGIHFVLFSESDVEDARGTIALSGKGSGLPRKKWIQARYTLAGTLIDMMMAKGCPVSKGSGANLLETRGRRFLRKEGVLKINSCVIENRY